MLSVIERCFWVWKVYFIYICILFFKSRLKLEWIIFIKVVDVSLGNSKFFFLECIWRNLVCFNDKEKIYCKDLIVYK